MPLEGVDGTQQPATESTQGPTSQLGDLDSEAFLKLLVAQLRYQNPMSPNDGSEMLQQTATFTQVETLQKVADAQEDLLGYHQTTIASAMVGKHVTAVGEEGEEFTGLVDGMRFSEDGPVLLVGDREIALDDAVQVHATDPNTSDNE